MLLFLTFISVLHQHRIVKMETSLKCTERVSPPYACPPGPPNVSAEEQSGVLVPVISSTHLHTAWDFH